MTQKIDSYAPAYRHYASEALAAVRRETYDEDIGQNSWLTAEELRSLIEWLDISAQSSVLEIACGSGGPACYVATTTGCRLTGIDNSPDGIANAQSLARQKGLADRVQFMEVHANASLPFPDGSFDALLCIDALNHLRDRRFVLSEWSRVLRTGGVITFTDPVLVTGPVTNAEFALRSSIGFFLFVPPGFTEKALEEAGMRLVRALDASDAAATIAARRRDARERQRDALIELEGKETFEGFQAFLQVVNDLTASRRLSRFIYHAVKP
ncbi:MAG: class I SAM-dependent methyltransferase [Gemmatimonadota bacterium]